MKRIATGIEGFDDLIEGGFPENSAIVLLGSYGTGKSIFALEYIYRGATMGEPGIYISFEETPDALREQALELGFSDFAKFEKAGKISLEYIPTDQVDSKTVKSIYALIKKKKCKRVVIDSLSALSINAPIYGIAQRIVYKESGGRAPIIQSAFDPQDLKKNFVYHLIRSLKELDVTSLLLSEVENGMSVDKVSEYVADGVIILGLESLGSSYSRGISIRKMRFTRIDPSLMPLEIGKGGIIISKIE